MTDRDSPRGVTTFRAPDSRAALDAVKAALGLDAVIVETCEVLGPSGRPEIEVSAMGSSPCRRDRPVPRPARTAR